MSKFRFQKLKPNTRRELQKISPLFLSEMAAAPEASPYLDEGVLAIRRPGGLLHEHLLRRVEGGQLLRARVLRPGLLTLKSTTRGARFFCSRLIYLGT